MKDWNDKDNFPPDDDDFSWLDDSEESPEEEDAPNEWQMPRPSKAEREIAARMEEAEKADFGDTDEFLDWMSETDETGAEESGVPDWLSDMDLPEVSEEEMAEASASVLGDKGDDFDAAWQSEFGGEEKPQDADDSEWGFEEEETAPQAASDDFGWGAEEESPEEEESGVSFDALLSSSGGDDNADSFLFGQSTADDEGDSFLFGQSSADDEGDSFLFGATAEEEDSDSFLFGASSGDDEEIPAKPSTPAGSEWGQVGSSWTGEMPAVPDEPEAPSGWNLFDDEVSEEDPAFSSLFGGESSEESSSSDVPDWLMDEDEAASPAPAEEAAADLGVPDWLMGMDEDEETVPAPAAQEDDEFDFLSDLGEPAAVSEVDDLLGDLAADDDDDDLGDLLAALDTEEDASVDDLLAALGSDDDDDGDLDSLLAGMGEAEEDPAADLDFLMDDEEEAAPAADLDFLEPVAPAAPIDDLDFFEPVAPAEAADDLDFFEPVTDSADDLDFFEPLAPAEATPADDLDFFEPVGEDAGFYQEDDAPDLDFLGEEEAGQDWFGEAAPADNLDFIDSLPENAQDGIDTSDLQESAKASEKPKAKAAGFDVGSLIDSFDDVEDEEPLAAPAADLDAIFGAMDDEDKLTEGLVPEWLRDVAEDVDETSAAAIIRQRRDRSLEEMDERLLALRESGLELTSDVKETEEEHKRIAKLVPNLEEGLVPVRVQPTVVEYAVAPAVSAEKQKNSEILSALIGTSEATTRVGFGDRLGRFFAKVPVSRWLISLMLLAAVIAPFSLSGFDDLGILPPAAFETESPEYAAFNLIENLQIDDTVLLATEYGATGARELDTATRAILEHIFVVGGKPVIVSSDAVGLSRAEMLTVELAGEASRNERFYIAGFLPAGTVGLRDFALNLRLSVSSDNRGQPTGLEINSLDDFTVIVLIAENGETVRNWM
jgi:hypothetical protein